MTEKNKENMIPCINEERFKIIESRVGTLEEIKQSLKNIEIALIGSDKLGVPGVIKTVDKHSKSLLILQRITYIVYGIGLGLGIVWAILKEII
jgi:hypothetical protein